ncbi:DUF4297 domain-containing protein [Xanthomonas hortorum pv. cynarae]|uniref:dsDNA nuclease domain-containing protein n=1 Tax=Xanthomonas hortorum TaxID=56454 RepID=UPI00135901CC|nr:dsDNA nuclease domain-containing protein [Xanthomonas hortorum]MCC4623173.1 DUF4297 domain-containing protein [Xanthomonas campestris pv. nigromaculans]MCE4350389.1 DUF4297 domain-containing protein [Xanthomonas hortorum pv. cynarae]CAD0329153.1 hypothetical protein CFBP2044_20870 [Xanthomonas hortorum pv. cynarae]CAD0329167.1 hypothetical protein CFBP2044_20870 [Xanthomonas hortorum pv. cynarae]CAH2708358.1 Cap4 dsDNA endonuclease [Xanthomonas campestris pv. nigromaculans]
MTDQPGDQEHKPDALELLLRDKPTDEKTGANATLGFTYQQWWGALAVAELLAGDEDFAVGMEVKEDVALLNSAESPAAVEFCQIKKNEQTGGWKLKDLRTEGRKRKDETRDASALAKLYKRRSEFSGHPTKLRFVSNVGVKVSLDAADDAFVNQCQLSDLATGQQDEIREHIGKQLGIAAATLDLSDFAIHRSDLPLGQQHYFLAGKLAELSESGKLPFDLKRPTVAARVLASILQSKASNTGYAVNFAELKKRLLSRSEAVQALASVAGAKPQIGEVLDGAIARLHSEAHAFVAVKAIQAERVTVLAHAVDRTNNQLKQCVLVLATHVNEVMGAAGGAKLGELMDKLVEAGFSANASVFAGLKRGYINAVALLVLNDGIEIDVLHIAADPKSEAQA